MAMKAQRFLIILSLLTTMLSLSACSSDNLKDRVSVCKAVVKQLLEVPAIDWDVHQQTTEAQSAITVRLAFNIHEQINDQTHSDHLSANCIYAYSDISEYEMVGQEYAESPTNVYINDKMVGHFTLTKAVNAVMFDAAKGLFNK